MTHSENDHHDWDDPERWSKEIRREASLIPATEALLDAVRVAPGRRILDLACGLGQTTAAAKARGVEALGLDLSQQRITEARRRFPHATFQVGDAARPPAGPWDAVVCRFGAHHLSAGWAEAVHRVLVPRGRVAIAEWPPRDERDRENGMRPRAHWERVLEGAGFQDVRVEAVTVVAPEDPEEGLRGEVLIITGQKPQTSSGYVGLL